MLYSNASVVVSHDDKLIFFFRDFASVGDRVGFEKFLFWADFGGLDEWSLTWWIDLDCFVLEIAGWIRLKPAELCYKHKSSTWSRFDFFRCVSPLSLVLEPNTTKLKTSNQYWWKAQQKISTVLSSSSIWVRFNDFSCLIANVLSFIWPAKNGKCHATAFE